MFSDNEINKAREHTLGCKELIHFNNAGASLMPQPVCQALHTFLETEERIGGYETAAYYQSSLDKMYLSAAQLINSSADEIAFVENATRAWQMAFYSFQFSPGDKILTAVAEYGSNVIAYLQQARRYGVEIVFVPNDKNGQIDCEALSDLIDDKVKLISMTHIPTGGGLVNPAQAVGKVANDAGVPYLLDACQSAGHIPIDVQLIGCDLLSMTGRKYLRGPRGTGLLYVRRSMLDRIEPVVLDQHAADLITPDRFVMREDARRFENWEQYYAGKYALGVAIDYALNWGLDKIKERNYTLASQLREELSSIDGVTVTDEGIEQCGIVTFASAQCSADAIKSAMTERSINVSVSDGSGSLVSFHQRDLTSVVRASLHYFNNEREIESFIGSLKEILA